MNRIYRTVYNETTDTWVAVCETAKTHTKSSGKSSVVGAIAAAGLMTVAGVAVADNSSCYYESGKVMCGQVTASGSDIVAIGNGASASAKESIAIGKKAAAAHQQDGQTIAIGAYAVSTGGQSIALGANTIATGYGAIAIGGDDISSKKNDQIKDSLEEYIDFLSKNKVESTKRVKILEDVLDGNIQVINSQIVGGEYDGESPYQATEASGYSALAVGQSSIASGTFSNAIGFTNTASGMASSAYGAENNVSGTAASAFGLLNNIYDEKSTAVGAMNTIFATGSGALGNNNNIATNSTFAFGNNITDTAANSVFLGDKSAQDANGAGATGTVSNATVGAITYGSFAGATSVGMVSVGNASDVRRVSGVAAGKISATSTDAINGSQLFAVLPTYEDDGNGNAVSVTVGDKTYNFAAPQGGGSGENNWNLTVNDEAASKPNDTRNLKDSDNIVINQTTDASNPDNANISFDLANVVTIGTPASKDPASGDKPVVIDGTANGGKITFTNADGSTSNAGVIDGVKTHFDTVGNNTTMPTNNAPSNWSSQTNQATTLGDVLNAGWGLKANDLPVDFVTHGDTVNFTSTDKSIAITPTNTYGVNSEIDLSANVVFYADKDAKQEATGTDKAKSVKVGNKTYQLGGDIYDVTGPNTPVSVVGQGSIKVEDTSGNANSAEYTVSIPVVANSDGNAATAASVANNSTGSVAVGESAAINNGVTNSIAIGKDTTVGNFGEGNVVIGSGSSSPNRAENMVIIGTNLKVTQGTPNAVVIGSGSVTASAAHSDFNPNQFTFRSSSLSEANEGRVNDAANKPVATFNVGAEGGQLRQIKGVAAGRTERGSTDAVNGDQLYTVGLAVDNMGYSLAGGGTVNSDGSIAGGTGVLGKSFTVNTDDAYGEIGTIIGKNIADTGADNIEDAIKRSRTVVQAGDGIQVNPVTANGATTYTVTGLHVTGTDNNGNATQLTGADGKIYNVGGADGNTVTGVTVNGGQTAEDQKTGGKDGNLKLTETKDNNGNPTYDVSLSDTVDLTDAGNLKIGGDKTGSPVTNITAGNIDFGDTQGSITNVKGHLEEQKDGDTAMNTANDPKNFDDKAKHEAATLGDVLNAGWNLQVGTDDKGNPKAADFVQHGDTVTFGNSDTVNAQYDNGVIKFDANTSPLTVTNGVVNAPANTNSLVTAGDVQKAINGAGWFVTSGAVQGKGTNSGASRELVTAGNEVKFIAGDGMNIVQNGKEFTFNAKIVDSNGKQLTVDKDGNYVVSIVDPKGKPVTINSDGQYVVDGGSGNGNPFTITADDGSGKPSTTTIDGVEKTPGAGVAFVGDENTSVTKQETPNGTNVQVGLNDVVNVGGKPDANNPNKKPVTIDGEQGNITFNGDKSKNEPSVTVSNQDGNLSVGDTKVVNMKPGENPTDGVNVSQLLDTVGAASSSPATDENGKPITDNNGNSIGNVVSTTGSDGNTYTLKTYNVQDQGEYLTNNVVEAVSKMNEQGIKFFHTNDGNQQPVAQNHNSVDASATGAYSTAIGYKAQANGESSIALGNGAQATGEQSISIGTGNIVSGNRSGAFGDPTTITGNGSYSIGNDNNIATDSTFALGSNITNTAANSVFLGDKSGQDAKGAGATGTVNDATVGDITYGGFAGATSVGMVSVGNASDVRRVSGVAAGEISATSTDAINGSQLFSALSNSGVYVTGNGAAPTDANLVKLGNKAGALNFIDGQGTTARVDGNSVTFDTVPGYAEGIQAGENVYLTYQDNTDAAGNPLYVTNAGGATNNASDPDVRLDANGNPMKQQTTVINAKQPDLSPVYNRIDDVDQDARGGVAQAIATAGLPQAYLPGKSMFAVAGGHYKGEQGYAFGLSTISDNGHWVLKATASGSSRKNFGGSLGAGYQW